MACILFAAWGRKIQAIAGDRGGKSLYDTQKKGRKLRPLFI